MYKQHPSPKVRSPGKDEAKGIANEEYLGEKSEPGASFAGMKKGFLSGGSTSKPKSQELIEVKRQTAGGTKDFRVLDEVQQVISDEQKAKSKTLRHDGGWQIGVRRY